MNGTQHDYNKELFMAPHPPLTLTFFILNLLQFTVKPI